MSTVSDGSRAAVDGLRIVERYEAVVSYVYKAIENCPRRHRAVRDVLVAQLLAPVGGLYHAAKSRQVSRLYAVDADFATLRMLLRLAASVRMITPRQQEHALALLVEAGRMLGAWIARLAGPPNKRPAQAPGAPLFNGSGADISAPGGYAG